MAAVDVIVVETVEVHVIEVVTEGPQGGGGVNIPLLPYSSANPPAGSISFVEQISGVSPGQENKIFLRRSTGRETLLDTEIS